MGGRLGARWGAVVAGTLACLALVPAAGWASPWGGAPGAHVSLDEAGTLAVDATDAAGALPPVTTATLPPATEPVTTATLPPATEPVTTATLPPATPVTLPPVTLPGTEALPGVPRPSLPPAPPVTNGGAPDPVAPGTAPAPAAGAVPAHVPSTDRSPSPGPARPGSDDPGGVVGAQSRALRPLAAETARQFALPLFLAALVVAFLAVQHRIDASDAKLVLLAPAAAWGGFSPPAPGGARSGSHRAPVALVLDDEYVGFA